MSDVSVDCESTSWNVNKKSFVLQKLYFYEKINTNLYGIKYFRSSSVTGNINLTNYKVNDYESQINKTSTHLLMVA